MEDYNERKTSQLPSLNEIKEYESNPFMVQLKGKMYLQPQANSIIARGETLVDTVTGEIITDDVLIGRRRIVDKSQFAKIYASEIGMLFGFSKAAINVLMYLSKVMDYDQRAYFHYIKDAHKLGYKTGYSTLKGLRELLKENIIAKDVRENTYWVNPIVICKGERFAKYTEFVTIERHEADLKREQEAMLRKQGELFVESLDEDTKYKYQQATKD